jgi:hypothetical protein
MRLKVEPSRSNALLNVSSTNPLVALACRGNHDIQYMANSFGGAEYVSKYASKADAPDNKVLQNVVSRKLATATLLLGPHEQLKVRKTLRIVGNAVVSSQQIGAVHACYVLAASNSLVQSSRPSMFLNAHIRKEINMRPLELDAEVLGEMGESESAIKDSPSTTFGRRDAYHEFVKEFHRARRVVHGFTASSPCPDFYAFASSYRLEKETAKPRGANANVREGLTSPLTINALTGLIDNAYSFTLKLVSVM